jgi:hypothetical protein
VDDKSAASASSAWGGAEPSSELWRSGPWSVVLEGDDLSDVRYAGRRVLLAVRAVVRDEVWNTVPVSVCGLRHDDTQLEISLRYAGFGALLEGGLRVTRVADALHVSLDLEARRSFDRARIGLVVLHPADLAGSALTVRTPAGATTRTAFPARIAPHQPAVDIAGLTWQTSDVTCTLALEGDTFEMEDQRNWTDASFKTYSTPLALPYPVRVKTGDHVRQSMTLTCTPRAVLPGTAGLPRPRARRTDPGVVPLRLLETGGMVPTVGLGASTAPGPVPAGLPPGVVSGVAHLLVELDAAAATWAAALRRARQEAGDRPLDVKVVVDHPEQVGAVVEGLAAPDRPGTADIVRLTVHSARTQVTEPDLWVALVEAASRAGIDPGRLYGGVRSDFTELNRHHARLPADLPALCFSMTPQVHATDRRQLIGSLEMQRLVTAQAVAIAAGRPVHVGPVTLRPRYNPSVAVPPAAPADLSEGYGAHLVPMATDPRQSSRAIAAWVLASAAAVAGGGAASITFAETWGPRGVVAGDGAPYPVAAAVEALTGVQGLELMLPEREGGPEDVWVLGARSGSAAVVLAANLTSGPVRLNVAIDARSVGVELAPFGIVREHLGSTPR